MATAAIRTCAAAIVALFLAGCTAPASTLDGAPNTQVLPELPDPHEAGALAVLAVEYDLGLIVVDDPVTGLRYPAALRGSVHYPAEGGPYPLVLFMHGRHGTCAVVGFETLGPGVCPETPVSTPVDSYKGYDYIAKPLAGHGYVVVSVDANHINEKDLAGDYGMKARAQLVMSTLDEFARINATGGQGPVPPSPVEESLRGRIDLSRIGLMGHSRGGEGVTKAIQFNRDRQGGTAYPIVAVFALAPTDFHRHVATDTAFATLLPYCDGDVSTLHGAWMYDDSRYADAEDSAPKHQILVLGANHNFYNTIWTGDDAGWMRMDGHCGATGGTPNPGSGRLTADDQRRNGLAYIAAFFRLYVGGETAFEPMFKPHAPPPPAACPAAKPACQDEVLVSYHAPSAARLTIEDTRDGRALTQNDLGGATTIAGMAVAKSCQPPSECPAERTYSRAHQVALGWDATGATFSTEVPAAHADASRYEALTLRVGVDYSDERNRGMEHQDATVRLVDAHGAAAAATISHHSQALMVPPGDEDAAKLTLNSVWIPLSEFHGVDLSNIRVVEIVFDITPRGLVQMADLGFQA